MSATDPEMLQYLVEVTPRYAEIHRQTWPIIVKPYRDELLESWLCRVAYANGTSSDFIMRAAKLSVPLRPKLQNAAASQPAIKFLADMTGVRRKTLSCLLTQNTQLVSLSLPMRRKCRPKTSTWLQFCPNCLANDIDPYFRTEWRLATRISCFLHRKRLRDRCPCCLSGISLLAQKHLIPQHICTRCGFDLRSAAHVSISAAARWLDAAIDAQLKARENTVHFGKLLLSLQKLPTRLKQHSSSSLTSLSTAARAQCFQSLGEDGFERLFHGTAMPNFKRTFKYESAV